MRDRESTGDELRLAYLVSAYPGTSHTFISREIAALRDLGVSLDTFSIKPATPAELEDAVLRREAERTYTVRLQPLASFLAAQVAALLSRPRRYLAVLGRALAHRPPGLRGFGMSFVYFAEAVLLARELKRRQITRLHNHFANAGAITGYLAASLLEIPWSFTKHGISETDYPSGLLLAKKIEAAEFVVCVSYFGRAQAMRLVAPDQWHKLRIVRCGLPLGQLPKRVPAGGMRRIVCVGRLSPEKGQAGLLQAFASVCAGSPELELVFVGDGPEAANLHSIADRASLSGKVVFTGRLSEQDTLEQIAASDILVLPSFMEGLPIVLMEAMAMGTAVIASRVAGIPELVKDGQSGLLFTPSDWEELAECIRQLLSDRALHQTLVKNAEVAVSDEYDIRKSASRLRELFTGGAP